jgi:hypothetical protein
VPDNGFRSAPAQRRVPLRRRLGTVRVWDLATGAPVGEPLAAHTVWVSSVAVTPDGTRIVSGVGDGTVRVCDLTTGAPVGKPLTGHGSVNSVVVTADGTRIVSGSNDGTVRIWDLATRKCLLDVALFGGVQALALGTVGSDTSVLVAETRPDPYGDCCALQRIDPAACELAFRPNGGNDLWGLLPHLFIDRWRKMD